MKYILQAIIWFTIIITICTFCFGFGTIIGLLCFIGGVIFWFIFHDPSVIESIQFGGLLLLGNLSSLPFFWLYKKLYGEDEFYNSHIL